MEQPVGTHEVQREAQRISTARLCGFQGCILSNWHSGLCELPLMPSRHAAMRAERERASRQLAVQEAKKIERDVPSTALIAVKDKSLDVACCVLCHKPDDATNDPTVLWIRCDRCSKWCHGQCAGVESGEVAQTLQRFECAPCVIAAVNSVLDRLLLRVQMKVESETRKLEVRAAKTDAARNLAVQKVLTRLIHQVETQEKEEAEAIYRVLSQMIRRVEAQAEQEARDEEAVKIVLSRLVGMVEAGAVLEAQGFQLTLSTYSSTGYRGVHPSGTGGFLVHCRCAQCLAANDSHTVTSFGHFNTRVDAAVAYAQHLHLMALNDKEAARAQTVAPPWDDHHQARLAASAPDPSSMEDLLDEGIDRRAREPERRFFHAKVLPYIPGDLWGVEPVIAHPLGSVADM
jgi:hypothetical protein